MKKKNNDYIYHSCCLELFIFQVCEMSSLLFCKGFTYLDMSWNAFLLNVNHYIRWDLQTFSSSFVKSRSHFVRFILNNVMETAPTESWELTVASLPNSEFNDFMLSAWKRPWGEYLYHEINTVNQGYFLFREVVVKLLPAHH